MNRKYLAISLVSLLAIIAGGAWGYMLYSDPITVDEKVLEYEYTYSGQFDFSAEVLNYNPIYDVGEVLSGMAGYFYSISPIMDIDFNLIFEPSIENSSANVSTTTILIVQSLDDDDVPFWSKELLLSSSSDVLDGSSSHHDSFSIDTTDIKMIDLEVWDLVGGSTGNTVGQIITTVTLDGHISNTEIIEEKEYVVPINFRKDYYSVENEESSEPVKNSYFSIAKIDSKRGFEDLWRQLAIIGGGFIVLILALYMGRDRDPKDYSEFKDWVSEGNYPDGDWEKEIFIPNLRDLVDVAIDTGKRVIYDKDEDIFFVIDNNIIYFLVSEEDE